MRRARHLSPLLAIAVAASTLVLVAGPQQAARAAAPVKAADVPVVGVGESSIAFSGDDGQNSLAINGLPVGSDGGVALSPDGHSGIFMRGRAPRPSNAQLDGNERQITFYDAQSRSVGSSLIVQPQDCWNGSHPSYSPDGKYIAVLCSKDAGTANNRLIVLNAADGSTAFIRDYPYPGVSDVAWAPGGNIIYVATAGIEAIPFNSGGFGSDQYILTGGSSIFSLALRPNGDVVSLTEDAINGPRVRIDTAYSGTGAWTPTEKSWPIPGEAGHHDLSLAADGARAVIEPSQTSLATVNLDTGAVTATQPVTLAGYFLSGFAISQFNNIHVISSNKATWRMDTWALSADGTMQDAGLVTAQTTAFSSAPPAIGTADAPVASFTNTSVSAGGTAHFDASSSQIASNDASYLWDFGGGVTQTTTVPSVDHIYPTSGAFNVTLTVTDSSGAGLPATTWWDGTHFVRRGSATASRTRTVFVNGNSSIDLAVTPSALTVGGRFHVVTTVHYPPQGAGSHFSSNKNQVTIYRNHTALTGDAAVCNSPVVFSNDANIGTATLTCDGPVEATPGPVAWSVSFDGDTSINPADSQEVDTTVSTLASGATLTLPATDLPATTPLTATATLTPGCGAGSYVLIVDGVQTATAPEIAGHSSHTFSQAVTPGRHLVKIAWTPDTADTVCTASTTSVGTVQAGTSATAITVAAAATSGPGTLPVTVAVTSPGGNPTSGSVTLRDGTKPVGSGSLTADGTVVLQVPFTAYGAHSLTATFAGSPVYGTSTSAPTVVTIVGKPGTAVVTGTAPRPGKLDVAVKADDHGSPITSYSVICSSKGLATRTAKGKGPVVLVSGLRNNVTYKCSAQATNALGTGTRGPTANGRPGRLPVVTLKASATAVGKGHTVTLSGTVTAADQPQTNRVVTLTRRVGNSKVRVVVAKARTDSHGRFHFTVKVTTRSAYQASAPVGPASPKNKEVTVRVA